jgi:hypothetical protein
MIIAIPLAASQTPTIRLYTLDTDTAATAAITGVARGSRPTIYDFDIGSVAAGDYDCDLASPGGFLRLRVSGGGYLLCLEWHELETTAPVGARARTFTVREQTTNTLLEGAKVRVTLGAQSYVLTTNASGVATASLDDGTWAVAITLPGYTFTPTTLVISATGSTTYDLAPVTLTPSSPGQTTGYWTVYDLNGVAQAGAIVQMQCSAIPPGSTGIVLEDSLRSATANGSGVVSFTGMFPGATYIVNRSGSARKFTITVPTTAGATVSLGSIVG